MLMRNTLLWLASNPGARKRVGKNRLVRAASRRFVAGETPAAALAVVKELNRRGAHVTLDYLGENVTSTADTQAVTRTYTDLIAAISAQQLDCNISLKLTALGLDINPTLCLDNMVHILEAARPSNTFIRIDMEGSDYTQATLDIFEQLYVERGYTNTGVVIQAYLYRSAQDIERAIQLNARVRLCKGAYKEAETVASPSKADVDENYMTLARRLLTAGHYPGLATHDEKIIAWAKTFVAQEGIGRERYEFQMLYGVRRDLQQQLVAEGYNVRVYVPFGEAWYPYLMRRMAERPANLLFVLRALGKG